MNEYLLLLFRSSYLFIVGLAIYISIQKYKLQMQNIALQEKNSEQQKA